MEPHTFSSIFILFTGLVRLLQTTITHKAKRGKREKKKVGHMLVLQTPFKNQSQLHLISVQKTHPDGHIVSLCKTQI